MQVLRRQLGVQNSKHLFDRPWWHNPVSETIWLIIIQRQCGVLEMYSMNCCWSLQRCWLRKIAETLQHIFLFRRRQWSSFFCELKCEVFAILICVIFDVKLKSPAFRHASRIMFRFIFFFFNNFKHECTMPPLPSWMNWHVPDVRSLITTWMFWGGNVVKAV